MLCFHTPEQALHAPESEFFRGQRVPCFENPPAPASSKTRCAPPATA
jgi:hypothetical protein